MVLDPEIGPPEIAVEEIKNHLFFERRMGAIDYHARDDVFEPAGSGGFLINGARLYIDAVGSHLEYATAECTTLQELIANDRAGQKLILQAIKELDWTGKVALFNNSVDHMTGHTFGSHENYMVRAEGELMNGQLHFLYPFLVTRQIYAGAGRVGGHLLVDGGEPSFEQFNQNPVDYIWVSQTYEAIDDPSVGFQLSQRADHILKTVASRVRFNRSLVNPKWETMYTTNGFTRLHVLFGEANQSDYAYALKIGATALAIRACEDGLIRAEELLQSPIGALRSISRDETYAWECATVEGRPTNAIEVQRVYRDACGRYGGESETTDWILTEWAAVLDQLEDDPMKLGDRLDWVAKRQIVDRYRSELGVNWGDPALHSVDLSYHHLDPQESLYHAWQQTSPGPRVASDREILFAQTDPPRSTRALGRGKLVEMVLRRKGSPVYAFDWGSVQIDRSRIVMLDDPTDPYEFPVDQWGNPVFEAPNAG